MSEYMVCDTQLEDWDTIVEALGDMGVTESMIEFSEKGFILGGFINKKKSNIRIKGQYIGSMHDVGFEKDINGMYNITIYDLDRSIFVKDIKRGKLKQCYAKRMTLKVIKKTFRRCKVKETQEENGKIRIRMTLSS